MHVLLQDKSFTAEVVSCIFNIVVRFSLVCFLLYLVTFFLVLFWRGSLLHCGCKLQVVVWRKGDIIDCCWLRVLPMSAQCKGQH